MEHIAMARRLRAEPGGGPSGTRAMHDSRHKPAQQQRRIEQVRCWGGAPEEDEGGAEEGGDCEHAGERATRTW